MMRLRNLIHNLPIDVKGSKELMISGLSSNSKLVAPGHLFIAKRGKTHDGHEFIQDALNGGVSAVLTDLYDPFLDVVQLIHPDPSSVEAILAATFYHRPSSKLKTIGITGTNGKTTCAYLTRHLLEHHQIPTGLIGTIETIIGDHTFNLPLTTPDAITLQKLIHEMVETNLQAAVLEVSSHALDQNRVDEIDFDVALFTNLSQDHLDYHGSMESYLDAKLKLFARASYAVINLDDPASPKVIEASAGTTLTYGLTPKADLFATLKQSGHFTIHYQGQTLDAHTKLFGTHNISNILGAIGVSLTLGLPLDAPFDSFKAPSGRLEKVKGPKGVQVIVDYAHTPNALATALKALRPLTKGQLWVIFGCGGDRDRSKRPLMGAVATEHADRVILTSDNPRSEDPETIINEIAAAAAGAYLEIDRAKAIRHALENAQPGDTVLIAGKGHEKEQIFDHRVIPLDDREICLKS